MNGHLLPDDGLNIFLSPGAIQFTHRLLALCTVATLTVMALRVPSLKPAAVAAWGQAVLGVATLLFQVPIPLAAAHQMGAIIVFALLVRAAHGLKLACTS